MEVFFIGVGSALTNTLYQTNFLLIKGDTHIMVDFGATGRDALMNTAGLKPTDIDAVLPTHSHSDHVGGIENIGLGSRYIRPHMNKPKVELIISEEYQRVLWDYTLRGGMEWNENVQREQRKLTIGDYFDIVRPSWMQHQPREVFKINYHGIKLEIFRTKHVPDSAINWEASFISYGLFVDNKLLITCDTRLDKELLDMYGHKSQFIFHDCQFRPEDVHASLDDLKKLPSDLKSKMYLMHYGDNWAEQNVSDFLGLAKQGVRYLFL